MQTAAARKPLGQPVELLTVETLNAKLSALTGRANTRMVRAAVDGEPSVAANQIGA